MRALEEIRQRQIHGTPTGDYVYNLYLAATGDEDSADRAESQFLLAQIRAGALKE